MARIKMRRRQRRAWWLAPLIALVPLVLLGAWFGNPTTRGTTAESAVSANPTAVLGATVVRSTPPTPAGDVAVAGATAAAPRTPTAAPPATPTLVPATVPTAPAATVPPAPPIAAAATAPVVAPTTPPTNTAVPTTQPAPAGAATGVAAPPPPARPVLTSLPFGRPDLLLDLAGRPAQLTNLRVREVLSGRAFYVGPSQRQSLLVYLEEDEAPAGEFRERQLVNVFGEIRQLPDAGTIRRTWGVDPSAREDLAAGQPYLHITEAADVLVVGQP